MSKLTALFRKALSASTSSNTSNTPKADPLEVTASNESNTPKEQTRWNGWGNININKEVSPHGAKLIKSHIGKTKKLSSVTLESVIKTVPPSRLPSALTDLEIVSTDSEVRVRHARGQSFPDWIAMHLSLIHI